MHLPRMPEWELAKADFIAQRSAEMNRLEAEQRSETIDRAKIIAAEKGETYDGSFEEAQAIVTAYDAAKSYEAALRRFGTPANVERVRTTANQGLFLIDLGRRLRWVVGVGFLVAFGSASEVFLILSLFGVAVCIALYAVGHWWPHHVERQVSKSLRLSSAPR